MFKCCSIPRESEESIEYSTKEEDPKFKQLKHHSSVVLQVIFVGGSIIVALGMIPAGLGLAGLTISSTPYFMFALGNGLTFYGIGALLGGGSLAIVELAIYSCVKGIGKCCNKSEARQFVQIGNKFYPDFSNGKPSAPPFEPSISQYEH